MMKKMMIIDTGGTGKCRTRIVLIVVGFKHGVEWEREVKDDMAS